MIWNIFVFAYQHVYTLRKYTYEVFLVITLSGNNHHFLNGECCNKTWGRYDRRLVSVPRQRLPVLLHLLYISRPLITEESADRSVQPVNREMKVKVPSVLFNGALYLLASGPHCYGSQKPCVLAHRWTHSLRQYEINLLENFPTMVNTKLVYCNLIMGGLT